MVDIAQEPPVRLTGSLTIVIIAICAGTGFQFYNNSVVGNLASICQQWMNQSYHDHYGEYIPDELAMQSLWSFSTAALQLGCLVGSFFSGILGDRLGRRKGLMCTSCLIMIGSVLDGFAKLADAFEMFIAGRCVMGLALGVGLSLGSVYISEIAPVKYRGACGSMTQVLVGFGSVLSYILTFTQVFGTETLWPIPLIVPSFVAGLVQFLVLGFYAHESPKYLVIEKDDSIGGLRSLIFYQGLEGAQQRLEIIEQERRAMLASNRFRFVDLFVQPELRKPLLVAILVCFGSQMAGGSAVLAYAKSIFEDAGLSADMSQFASMGLGLCNLVSPFVTMFLVERVGRKSMFLTSLSLCIVCLVALTICLAGSQIYQWPGASVGTLPVMFIFQLAFAVSVSIVFIIPAELILQNARAKAVAFVFGVWWTLQSICVLGYLPFSVAVGVEYSYLPFVACVAFSVSILIFVMPETKGKSIEEVVASFTKQGRPASSSNQQLCVDNSSLSTSGEERKHIERLSADASIN